MTSVAQSINGLIESIESTALSLAQFAAEVHNFKQAQPSLNADIIFKRHLFNTFTLIPHSIGGGVWFEPNIFDIQQRWYGPYIYRDHQYPKRS